MPFTPRRVYRTGFFIFFAVLCLCTSAHAEGGGGGADNGADREWARRITSLNKLEARIKDDAGKLQTAIKEKNSSGGGVKPIVQSYDDLVKSMKEYNRQKETLKYKYPEEGEMIERRYLPMRAKPLNDYENTSGFNAELTQLKKKIDKTYAPFIDSPVKPTAEQIDKAHGVEKSDSHKNTDSTTGRLKLSY